MQPQTAIFEKHEIRYRKYVHGDIQWYQHYADKIVFETEYLGSEQA